MKVVSIVSVDPKTSYSTFFVAENFNVGTGLVTGRYTYPAEDFTHYVFSPSVTEPVSQFKSGFDIVFLGKDYKPIPVTSFPDKFIGSPHYKNTIQ